jgi:predicted TIM-barrel fold metal-dependent hydrolase
LGVAAAAGGIAAWRLWPEQGFWNPCHAQLPRRLANHELVREAWSGINPARVWDSHSHLIGTGDSGSGIFVHPRTESLLDPGQYARRLFFLNAGCVHAAAAGSVDRAYVDRIRNLIDAMNRGERHGVKLLLYAFERAYNEDGTPDPEHTIFHIPDAYARDVAKAHPDYFEWVASIHPYRKDALEALEQAKRNGARAVKWLPSAMGIDPASDKCDAFFRKMQALKMPLVAHGGLERAVLGREAHDFGNPLRLRRALDAGVRVVVAHCASIGEDRDLDRGANGPYVESFSLFVRVFEKFANCYGDISAMTQVNRAGPALVRVIETEAWHARLLNGSDYPLPGVMPIFSVDYLVSLKLLEPAAAAVLREIRLHNPLLFDFVLKRHLRSNRKALAARVFETREFFMR